MFCESVIFKYKYNENKATAATTANSNLNIYERMMKRTHETNCVCVCVYVCAQNLYSSSSDLSTRLWAKCVEIPFIPVNKHDAECKQNNIIDI